MFHRLAITMEFRMGCLGRNESVTLTFGRTKRLGLNSYQESLKQGQLKQSGSEPQEERALNGEFRAAMMPCFSEDEGEAEEG